MNHCNRAQYFITGLIEICIPFFMCIQAKLSSSEAMRVCHFIAKFQFTHHISGTSGHSPCHSKCIQNCLLYGNVPFEHKPKAIQPYAMRRETMKVWMRARDRISWKISNVSAQFTRICINWTIYAKVLLASKDIHRITRDYVIYGCIW